MRERYQQQPGNLLSEVVDDIVVEEEVEEEEASTCAACQLSYHPDGWKEDEATRATHPSLYRLSMGCGSCTTTLTNYLSSPLQIQRKEYNKKKGKNPARMCAMDGERGGYRSHAFPVPTPRQPLPLTSLGPLSLFFNVVSLGDDNTHFNDLRPFRRYW